MGVRSTIGVALVLSAAIAASGLSAEAQGAKANATGALGATGAGGTQRTVRDKLYTKEQAARGGELSAKYCDKCHIPEKVPEGKKPGPPTVGPKFIETWMDRTLGELFDTIFTTMPSDGSATLTADQTLDLVAHILKGNGFPEGTSPLKNDDAMKSVVIVK
jgi:hypothetical protein